MVPICDFVYVHVKYQNALVDTKIHRQCKLQHKFMHSDTSSAHVTRARDQQECPSFSAAAPLAVAAAAAWILLQAQLDIFSLDHEYSTSHCLRFSIELICIRCNQIFASVPSIIASRITGYSVDDLQNCCTHVKMEFTVCVGWTLKVKISSSGTAVRLQLDVVF